MALKCDFCQKNWIYRIKITEEGKQICSDCYRKPSIEIHANHERIWIGGDIGWELKSRVNEARRRVILPYDRKDGKSDYYVGRRLDSGKIEEREPCY